MGSKAEGTWTSTSSTRDASLIFNTVLNGNNELALTLASDKSATFAGTITSSDLATFNNGITLGGSNETLKLLYNNTANYIGNLGWAYLQLGNNGANDLVAGNTAANGYFRFYTNNTNDIGGDAAPNGTLVATFEAGGDAIFHQNVGIGTAAPTFLLHAVGDQDILKIEGSGANGPQFRTYDSSTASDDDGFGLIDMAFKDSGGNETIGNRIKSVVNDVTNGTEDTSLEFYTLNNANLTKALTLDNTQNATFTGTVEAGGTISQTSGNILGRGYLNLQNGYGSANGIYLYGNPAMYREDANTLFFPLRNISIKNNGGGNTKFVRIWNTGTADGDDAVLSFKTESSRTYSIGTHRDSGAFLLTNADASVASGELLTIDNSGNATFTGKLLSTVTISSVEGGTRYGGESWSRYLLLDAAVSGGGGIIWTKQSGTYNRSILANHGDFQVARSTADDNSGSIIKDLVIDNTGKFGVGCTVPINQKLTVTGSSGACDGNLTAGVLSLTTGTGVIADTRLLFGIVDDTYAWIQAADYGVAYRDISLNPNGGNVSIKVAGAAKAKLHVKNDSNSWEDGVLLEHHTGNTGWNIHPEDNSDNALWFGYNADTSVGLTSQAATAALKLNSDLSAIFAGVVDATNYKINGAQGSDGQVLTSTGSGVAWESVAGSVSVSDSTANTDFPVVFHDESNNLHDDTGAFEYNPSTGALTIGGNVSTAAAKRISIGTWDNSAFTGGAAQGYFAEGTTPMLILEETDQSKTCYMGMSGGNMYTGGIINNFYVQTNDGTTRLTIDSSGDADFTGDVGMATGHSSGKFAVMSSSVHGSYDFYNNGTSYFNGDVTIDANLTQTTGTSATFSGTVICNNVGTDKKIQFNRTSGNTFSIEHDTSQIYFWNATTSTAAFKISNASLATFAGGANIAGKVGIGTTDPDGDGYSYAEDLVIKGGNSASDGAGITIAGNGKTYGVIAFGDAADNNIGEIYYSHSDNSMNLRTNTSVALNLDSSGNAKIKGAVIVNNSSTISTTTTTGEYLTHQQNSQTMRLLGLSSSWCHILTTANNFYFDKGLRVDTGAIGTYDEDMQLNRAGTNFARGFSNGIFQPHYLGGYDGVEGGSTGRRFITKGSGDNSIYFGCYDDNGYGYLENYNNSSGMYFNTAAGHFRFDTGSVIPYNDSEIYCGLDANRWICVYADGFNTSGQIDWTNGFSIKQGGSNYGRIDNWVDIQSTGFYSTTLNGAHIYPNNYSSYASMALSGSRNGYYGMLFANIANKPHFMFDASGNGGEYHEGNGTWASYWHVSNACMGIGNSTTSSSYTIYSNGAIYSTGDVVAYSDRRAKENIVTVDNALDKVSKLRGVYYNKKDSDEKKREVGVIAQEVKEVLPEVVTYAKDVDEYGVDYGKINGLLIEAIKDLKKEIEELKQCKKCTDCDCNN